MKTRLLSLGFLLCLAVPVTAQHEGEHAVTAAEHGVGHAEHGAAHGHVWNYGQLGGMTVNFALWLFGLIFLLKKMDVSGSLRARKSAIVDGMAEAKLVKAAAEAKYKEYSERMDNMDKELATIRADMQRAGVEERDKIVAEAEKRGQKMREEAKFLVEQRIKQMREQLTRETIRASMAQAEASIRGTSASEQDKLVQSYITGLAAAAKSTEAGR